MDKQEFEWKAKELTDKAEDLFQDEDNACCILSTGFQYDEKGYVGHIKCSGYGKHIMISAARIICTVCQKESEDEDTTPLELLNALFMMALKMMMDDDE